MSLRVILRWPDARLRMVCAPVPEVTPEIHALAGDLLETMYAAPGRGLAAPQVGEVCRVFVMDTGWKEGVPQPRVFVNPEILARSDDTVTRAEGCLSIPGVSVDVTRPAEITLRWTDLEGRVQQDRLTGFAAACAQHEIDHLDGRVTFDRLTAEARALAEAQFVDVSA
ncbi:peptide deformylase [uncultured Roseobacter sp.]|uniref:peptide deformylase n=1 Tax=uncultured Roseobacter sp. TaxID=114847 RepID=UPI00261BED5B|nr:peptide deformylase [uncultured Roseobacter sp.]